MTDVQTRDDWPFDEECPNCGEDVHIGAIVEVQDDDGPVKAEMHCGTEPGPGLPENGCGHTWDWEREE